MEMDDFDDFKIILWLILFLLFGIVIISCKRVPDEVIMTVNGPELSGRWTIERSIKAAREGTWISLDNIRIRDIEQGSANSVEWYAERSMAPSGSIRNRSGNAKDKGLHNRSLREMGSCIYQYQK